MKNTLLQYKSPMVKFFFIIICMTIGLMASTDCAAQNIIGKWKGVSVTNYFGADYAKQKGRSTEQILAKDAGYSEMDYRADHSFTMIFYTSNNSEATILSGTWETNGDQLTLTLNPEFNPQKKSTVASFVIHGDMMETTASFAPGALVIKTVSSSSRFK
jgi:hypothetical protein